MKIFYYVLNKKQINTANDEGKLKADCYGTRKLTVAMHLDNA